ncbi:MAG TPA: class I SAM-dependent methyltransferase [Gemmatimonadaceae bacterium]|nr:class I SAM-dependent methyltransferase [Gemmatimonadaceae bacterium]
MSRRAAGRDGSSARDDSVARLFDGYAASYRDTVQRAISASGESVEYFAALKLEHVKREMQNIDISRILDFGCGTGTTALRMAQHFPHAHVTGVDPSLESIGIAKQAAGKGQSAEFVWNQGDELPFPPGSFDLTFTACVFHHIDRDEHARWAGELFRTLRPGGSLMLFEHNPFNPLTRKVVRDCPFDAGVQLLYPRYTRRLLADAGFRIAAHRFYFFFPRALRWLRGLERGLTSVPLGGQYYVRAIRPE